MSNTSNTLVDSLLATAASCPNKIAFLEKDAQVSFSQFAGMISRIAQQLKAEGLVPGDRVLICGPNSICWAAAYFGIHAAGCIAVPVDADASTESIQRIFGEIQPRLAFATRPLPVDVPIVPLTIQKFDDFTGDFTPLCRADDIADILCTTGTTGHSKNVVLTHSQIYAAATNITAFIGNGCDDLEVVPIPLSHSFGLGRLRSMALSGTALALEAGMPNAARLFKRILDLRATGLALVPAGFEILLRITGNRLGEAGAHLRYIEIGSAAMRMETKLRLMELLPRTRICHHYGLTEASRAAFIEYHADREHLTSIGKPSPNVEVAICDESGRFCSPGEPGELVVRGKMVMKEYWNHPAETMRTLRDGWLHTGDWGYKDTEGYLYLLGRRADIINIGGMKVWPDEVEAVINSHPDIVESACVGVADPENITGECIQAFIVARNPVSDAELITWLRSRLEEYKIPRIWCRVSAIPKTGSGKIRRSELV